MSRQFQLMQIDPCPLVLWAVHQLAEQQSDLTLVAQSRDATRLWPLWQQWQPELTILHLCQTSPTDFATLRRICHASGKLLVLSNRPDRSEQQLFLDTGVCGYLSKNTEPNQLLLAVRAIQSGKKVLEFCTEHNTKNSDHLTHREVEVLKRVSRGEANKSIASNLCISEWTVKSHMKNILSKLNAISRTEAVSIGVQRGLIHFL
ncbi:response regulator transcription factor [Rheinheimera sp.]|uniref:response regulator transcription factor n=1 Tax=Rheinheimera sp. TaxID=1869214 RepID=UPI00307DE9C9